MYGETWYDRATPAQVDRTPLPGGGVRARPLTYRLRCARCRRTTEVAADALAGDRVPEACPRCGNRERFRRWRR